MAPDLWGQPGRVTLPDVDETIQVIQRIQRLVLESGCCGIEKPCLATMAAITELYTDHENKVSATLQQVTLS